MFRISQYMRELKTAEETGHYPDQRSDPGFTPLTDRT